MALIVTLSLLVLVTFAVMAFFTRATSNLQTESERSQQVLAEQVIKSAESHVVGLFLAELANDASNEATAQNPIYRVTKPEAMVPERKVASSSASLSQVLRRQSVASGDPAASGNSTAAPARNGRSIPAARWNEPRILASAPPAASFSSNDQLPCWIYLQGNGTVSKTATGQTIGRFAYNVYEVGGLLDANVAGFPAGTSAIEQQKLKSSVAGADVSSLSGNATSMVAFRDPGATAANYPARVSDLADQGFRNPQGDGWTANFFRSRLDLLNYVESQNSSLASALPYMHPGILASTAPEANPANSSANPFIPAAVVSTEFTRADGSTARAGTSLVASRFPLSRLQGLGFNGINSTSNSTMVSGILSLATVATIRRDFGLVWNVANLRWDYEEASGFAIKSLAEVADAGREPNFFELLKAGITAGSLGVEPAQSTLAPEAKALDGNINLQVLRIGANLIDQQDADNYPTRLSLNGIEVAGVEDLPYLGAVITNPRGWCSGTMPDRFLVRYGLVLAPKLFNPHAPSSPAGGGPASVRARIANGTMHFEHDLWGAGTLHRASTPGDAATATPLDPNDFGVPAGQAVDISAGGTVSGSLFSFPPAPHVTIPAGRFDEFRAKFRVPHGGDVTNADCWLKSQMPDEWGGGVGQWWDSPQGVAAGTSYTGWVVAKLTTPRSVLVRGVSGSTSFYPNVTFTNLSFVMEFQDAGGHWRVYDSFAGTPSLPITGIQQPGGVWWSFTPEWNQNYLGAGPYAAKWDVRTNRWGPSGWDGGDDNKIGAENPQPVGSTAGKLLGVIGNLPFSALADPNLLGLWPQGNSTTYGAPGTDGILRPNDGFRGDAANPFRAVSGNTIPSDHPGRPVILQRPFQSAGEMGYAFRDTPWQTLSFFDETSGDSALLPLFTAEETPRISGGKINLNTAPVEVIAAMLRGASRQTDGTEPLTNPDNLASEIAAFRTSTKAFRSVSELVNFTSNVTVDADVIKRRREALVRALADASQVRTWNLFADIIAQSGRLAPGGSEFLVEGESRVWVDLALDRITGKLLNSRRESLRQ